ncbi:cytochrome b [Paraburkholderia flagellata]|uniref:cytochrome b n=1 Tax=Paraburkholderia flagellata TaxID=2883241 RepID=UPI001F1EDF63|nr:cytochrome b [Paraburkholderia flagellata]
MISKWRRALLTASGATMSARALTVERAEEPTIGKMSCGALADERSIVTAQTDHSGSRTLRRATSGGALDRYDGVARFFHWTFAASIIYASIAGYTLARIGSGPVHDFLSQLNMSIGTVLLVLFPFRVGWKLIRPELRELPGVSVWQQSLARFIHGVIYVTIFAVLISGFFMVSNGYSFFGLFEIRTPFQKGQLTDKLFAMHRVSCATLAGLVMLHVLAVIKHQLLARNDVLRRML